jgi:hypothetical protein
MASISLTNSNGAALTRGADYSFGLTLTDASGTAINTTGWGASVVLLRYAGADLIATFTTTVSSSLITASLSHAVTAALPIPIPDSTGFKAFWVKILLTRASDGIVLSGGEGPIEILP